MKKHISIIAGILLLMTTSILCAQDPGVKALQSIAKSIKSHQNIEVAFTMSSRDDVNKPMDKKDGTAIIEGDSYKLIFDDLQVICDGKTVWTYYIEEQEAMIGNATDEDNAAKLYIDLLTQSQGGLLGTDDDNNSIIGLYDMKGHYQDINLIVNAKGDPKKVEFVADNDEVMISLELHSLKFDQKLKDGFFTFDQKDHPDVELIDMR